MYLRQYPVTVATFRSAHIIGPISHLEIALLINELIASHTVESNSYLQVWTTKVHVFPLSLPVWPCRLISLMSQIQLFFFSFRDQWHPKNGPRRGNKARFYLYLPFILILNRLQQSQYPPRLAFTSKSANVTLSFKCVPHLHASLTSRERLLRNISSNGKNKKRWHSVRNKCPNKYI